MNKEQYRQELARLNQQKSELEAQMIALKEAYIEANRRFKDNERVMRVTPEQERMVGSIRTGYTQKRIPEQRKFYYIAGYTLGANFDVVPILTQENSDQSMGKNRYTFSETDAVLERADS